MLPTAEPLVEPFEWIQTQGPTAGRVERPLLYALEHVVLPDCLFTWHPELSATLRGRGQMDPPFLHMWSKAKVFCDDRRLIPMQAQAGFEGYLNYFQPMARSIRVMPVEHDEYDVWILTMPTPKDAPDCIYVALCKPKDESDDYLLMERSQRSRYFTLETSGQPGSGYFCEWRSNGSHANFGYEADVSVERFQYRVTEELQRRLA
jgi:hypothetical protein